MKLIYTGEHIAKSRMCGVVRGTHVVVAPVAGDARPRRFYTIENRW